MNTLQQLFPNIGGKGLEFDIPERLLPYSEKEPFHQFYTLTQLHYGTYKLTFIAYLQYLNIQYMIDNAKIKF